MLSQLVKLSMLALLMTIAGCQSVPICLASNVSPHLYQVSASDILPLAQKYGFRGHDPSDCQVFTNASGTRVILYEVFVVSIGDIYVFGEEYEAPKIIHRTRDYDVRLDDAGDVVAVKTMQSDFWCRIDGTSLGTKTLVQDGRGYWYVKSWEAPTAVLGDIRHDGNDISLTIPPSSDPYKIITKDNRLFAFCQGKKHGETQCLIFEFSNETYHYIGSKELAGSIGSVDPWSDQMLGSKEIWPLLWETRLFDLGRDCYISLGATTKIPMFLKNDWFVKRLKTVKQ